MKRLFGTALAIAALGFAGAAHADTTPTAPTGLGHWNFTTTGSTTSVPVHWTPPSSNGGSALTYEITTTPATSTVTTSSSSATLHGLTAGSSYTFSVKATNGGGLWSSATSSSFTTPTAASAPTGVTATAGSGKITVGWSTPSSLGSLAAGAYTVTPRINGVFVLAPPVDDRHGAVLALLSDGEAWSSSALALALGMSPRTVLRALEPLAVAGKVQHHGRGRAQRWVAAPLPGFTTTLLLPGPLPGE